MQIELASVCLLMLELKAYGTQPDPLVTSERGNPSTAVSKVYVREQDPRQFSFLLSLHCLTAFTMFMSFFKLIFKSYF